MKPTSSRGIAAALAALALVAGCAGCAQAPQFEAVGADGEVETVSWRTFPATPGTDTELVLAGPMAEDAEQHFAELRDDLIAALDAKFGAEYGPLDWAPHDAGVWADEDGNGFRGDSMLRIYNSPTWRAEAVLPPAEWARVGDVVARVAEQYGIAGRGVDALENGRDAWMRSEWLSRGTEWVSLRVVDATRDPEGLRESRRHGWLETGIEFSYGISTIGADERAEFERRAAPFIGLEHPEPVVSD